MTPTLVNTWVPMRDVKPRSDIRYDVCAKRWDPVTDTFAFKRFTDCTWSYNDGLDYNKTTLKDIGYRPVYIMLIELPKEEAG